MADSSSTSRAASNLSVVGIAEDETGTRLRADSAQGSIALIVPTKARIARAREWAASVRRIDHVVLHIRDGAVSCRASGQGRRLPFSSPLPLAVALGLGYLGVPLRITGIDL